MAEYIKRDAAIREIEQINPVDYGAMWDYEAHHWAGECLRDCKEAIDSIPTADVAPVVRCKDCKHLCVWNRKDLYAFCPKTNIVFLPFDKDTRTFFCSLGERKDGGDG